MTAAVVHIVSALQEKKTKRTPQTSLSAKEEAELQRKFKDAQQGRSSAYKFMLAAAKAMKVKSPEDACKLADMKDWGTTVDKFKEAKRSTNDIGRGRIYIENVDEYYAFQKLNSSKDRNGHLDLSGTQRAAIIPGSINDYLMQARSSGYAGSVNFDLEVDLGKGRQGRFECQLIPSKYKDMYEHSHALYDMIRIFDEIPKAYLNKHDLKLRDLLIKANEAFFFEYGERTGFIDVRKPRPRAQISNEEYQDIITALDLIRTTIEDLPGRNLKWKRETAEATTYAKTSVTHVYLASMQKHGRSPGIARDLA